MRDAGAAAVVAEVSSHALAQGRVAGGVYDLALFTNLTRDHLDYHADLEAYFDAKRILFGMLGADGRAAIGIDDAYGRRLLAELPGALGFGRAPDAAVRPAVVELDVAGLSGTLRTPRGALRFESRLVGDYNLSNILAAVAGAEALEIDPEATAAGLAACLPLPGRMERVSRRGGVDAFVDYAHTDAALRSALDSARRLTAGRVVVVFGCGGDRDRGKRAPMGRAAGELADLSIVTSDNPRGEDPGAIVAQVLPGLEASGGEFLVRLDRREAIRLAVELAGPGDLVLVAGKGHESTQIVGEREIPFSDRDELVDALEERFGPSQAG
jgi:UDP-N-acetylmuramoyl-L-alanyl-D-glutamate--2,6-diaminopimelate ligase